MRWLGNCGQTIDPPSLNAQQKALDLISRFILRHMKATTKRTVLRWIHILFALPLIGFIYGPPAETEPYRVYFQYLYMPLVALSGLLMWKGHVLARLFARRSK